MDQKVILCILDGWGHSLEKKANAIKQAETLNYDIIESKFPKALLSTSGADVGLPSGQMGNSEVGHTNIGAGRVVFSDLPRINEYFEKKKLGTNEALLKLMQFSNSHNREVHVIGLVSDGGVHSHQDQIFDLVDYISDKGLAVSLHMVTDGRDVGPRTALDNLRMFERRLPENVRIATLMGRFYAMDRDQRWDRTKLAFDAIANGQGKRFDSAIEAIEASYADGIFDEFIMPCSIGDYYGAVGNVNSLVAMNFRADRFRQILTALLMANFGPFDGLRPSRIGRAIGLISYSKELDSFMDIILPAKKITNTLGSILAQKNRSQLRIAETEKYAHVTYFFNGGEEKPFENEDRILVKSPLVETYDQRPEMSCYQVCDELTSAIFKGKYDFTLVNFANPDMVGHTGQFEATKSACEAIDDCIGKLVYAAGKSNSIVLLTSDHGNAELMYDFDTHMPHTRHTLNPVPFHLIGSRQSLSLRPSGRLCDIAPTVLELLGLSKPKEMCGISLLR